MTAVPPSLNAPPRTLAEADLEPALPGDVEPMVSRAIRPSRESEALERSLAQGLTERVNTSLATCAGPRGAATQTLPHSERAEKVAAGWAARVVHRQLPEADAGRSQCRDLTRRVGFEVGEIAPSYPFVRADATAATPTLPQSERDRFLKATAHLKPKPEFREPIKIQWRR